MDYSSVIVAVVVLVSILYCAQAARRKFHSLDSAKNANAQSASTQNNSACSQCAGACRK